MKTISFLTLSCLFILLSSCGGGGNSDKTAAENFVDKVNQYTSNDITLVKDPTKQEGYIIVQNENDYYYAIKDISCLSCVTDSNSQPYDNYADYFYDKRLRVYDAGNGYFERDRLFGGTVLYEEVTTSAKDLEKLGAIKEHLDIASMSDFFATEFELSEARSLSVAKLVNSWNKVSKKRSMTEKDAKHFSEALLGFDASDAAKAYQKFNEGDDSDLNQLLETAASVNETSPEHMRTIFVMMLEQNSEL